MTRIGLLSDTHGHIHPKAYEFFADTDEIWHAGDIGHVAVIEALSAYKPLRAVYGNIDGTEIRVRCPRYQLFTCEQIKVLMTHIGGYPGKYDREAREKIAAEKPGIFVSGHSHILKVMYDKRFGLLHINPGAAGNSGLHRVITFVRFVIDGSDIRDMEIFESPRKERISDY